MNKKTLALAAAAVAAVAVGTVATSLALGDSTNHEMAPMRSDNTHGEMADMGQTMDMGEMMDMGETTDMKNEEMEGTADDRMPGMEQQGAPPAVSSLPETPILSPTRMGGLVMPPGMIVTRDTSMEAMAAMAAVDLRKVGYTAPAGARGDRPLQPRVVGGRKVFQLRASLVRWSILPDVQVAAYAFNGQVPGPRIRVTEGDRVLIVVRNDLPEPTSVHWHGLAVPNRMDGAAGVTQPPIASGKRYTYEFTAGQAGTFFYHSHQQADRQQSLGMYGALIVDPKRASVRYDREAVVQLGEWTVEEGYTFPSMQQEGLLPNYFTINGKAYPATQTLRVNRGERILFRFIGSQSGLSHPMHIHGGPFAIVATDGNPVPASVRIDKDTIAVGPGERYDVVWTAQRKGTWLLHCHVLHHTTNDDLEVKGGGGLTMVVDVT